MMKGFTFGIRLSNLFVHQVPHVTHLTHVQVIRVNLEKCAHEMQIHSSVIVLTGRNATCVSLGYSLGCVIFTTVDSFN